MLPHWQIASVYDISCHGLVAKGLLILENRYKLCGRGRNAESTLRSS